MLLLCTRHNFAIGSKILKVILFRYLTMEGDFYHGAMSGADGSSDGSSDEEEGEESSEEESESWAAWRSRTEAEYRRLGGMDECESVGEESDECESVEEESEEEGEELEEEESVSWADWVHNNEADFRRLTDVVIDLEDEEGGPMLCENPEADWKGEDWTCNHGKTFSACVNYDMCGGVGGTTGQCDDCLHYLGEKLDILPVGQEGDFCAICLTAGVARCKYPQCTHRFCGPCFKTMFFDRKAVFCSKCPMCKRPHNFVIMDD